MVTFDASGKPRWKWSVSAITHEEKCGADSQMCEWPHFYSVLFGWPTLRKSCLQRSAYLVTSLLVIVCRLKHASVFTLIQQWDQRWTEFLVQFRFRWIVVIAICLLRCLIVYTCVVRCVVCAFLAWTGKTYAKTKPFKKWRIGIKSFAFVSLLGSDKWTRASRESWRPLFVSLELGH